MASFLQAGSAGRHAEIHSPSVPAMGASKCFRRCAVFTEQYSVLEVYDDDEEEVVFCERS